MRAQQGQAVDDGGNAFARDDAAQLEHDELAVRDAEFLARQTHRYGPQFLRVKSAGNHGDAIEAGAVVLLHVGAVLRTLGNDGVGAAHERMLDAQAGQREGVVRALREPAHMAERVEGDDEGQAEGLLEVLRDHAGHEEVGVGKVVDDAVAADVAGHEAAELVDIGQQVFLGHEMGRADRHLDDADAFAPGHALALADRVAPDVDIDHAAACRQLARQVGHVDILAATIDAAGLGERRRMVADQGDAQRAIVRGGRLQQMLVVEQHDYSFGWFGRDGQAGPAGREDRARSGARAGVAVPGIPRIPAMLRQKCSQGTSLAPLLFLASRRFRNIYKQRTSNSGH